MYCSNCGKENNSDSNYCSNCGASLNRKSQTEFSFYNNNTSSVFQSKQTAKTNTEEGKVAGVLCGLFVPIIISIFIGLIYNDPTARSNYYRYYFVTVLIKICFVILLILLIAVIAAASYGDFGNILKELL